MTSILVFAGSARRGAFSKQLAAAATTALADWSAKPTLIDLADYDTPIYNGDLEEALGIPDAVLEFRRLVATHHGLAIATPEYNGFVTPLLLNMFCWASRPSPGDDFGTVFQGKPVALMASSPGRLGGVRAIPRLRDVVAELGMAPTPGFVTVPTAGSAFTDDGRLAKPAAEDELRALMNRLIKASQP
jgi:chromate reductase